MTNPVGRPHTMHRRHRPDDSRRPRLRALRDKLAAVFRPMQPAARPAAHTNSLPDQPALQHPQHVHRQQPPPQPHESPGNMDNECHPTPMDIVEPLPPYPPQPPPIPLDHDPSYGARAPAPGMRFVQHSFAQNPMPHPPHLEFAPVPVQAHAPRVVHPPRTQQTLHTPHAIHVLQPTSIPHMPRTPHAAPSTHASQAPVPSTRRLPHSPRAPNLSGFLPSHGNLHTHQHLVPPPTPRPRHRQRILPPPMPTFDDTPPNRLPAMDTMPTIPNMPNIPTIPGIPGRPAMSNIPTMPPVPSIPTMSTTPTSPTVPGLRVVRRPSQEAHPSALDSLHDPSEVSMQAGSAGSFINLGGATPLHRRVSHLDASLLPSSIPPEQLAHFYSILNRANPSRGQSSPTKPTSPGKSRRTKHRSKGSPRMRAARPRAADAFFRILSLSQAPSHWFGSLEITQIQDNKRDRRTIPLGAFMYTLSNKKPFTASLPETIKLGKTTARSFDVAATTATGGEFMIRLSPVNDYGHTVVNSMYNGFVKACMNGGCVHCVPLEQGSLFLFPTSFPQIGLSLVGIFVRE